MAGVAGQAGSSPAMPLVTPLTTIFTPPCGLVIQTQDISNTCGPPEMESVWKNGGYYSPGVCPLGYVTDCTRTATDRFHPLPIDKGETVASCIPR
jgi:hypothetical protein